MGAALLMLLIAQVAFCQESNSDSLYLRQFDDVIISATKSKKKTADLTIPAIVIGAEEIQTSGFTQLNEILEEQTGITLTEDHGTGIQIQGFDPEYTMVLLDGEPLIGRNAGILDLKRISLRNVERLEIVKGGSSCLFGSDAMGGVLNIITKTPGEVTQGSVFAMLGSPLKAELGTNLSGRYKSVGWQFFGQTAYHHGFDLNENKAGVTQGRAQTNNVHLKTYHELGSWELKPSLRYYYNKQLGDDYESSEGAYFSEGFEQDVNMGLQTKKKWNKGITTQLNWYTSLYKTEGYTSAEGDLGPKEESAFEEIFHRLEAVGFYPATKRSHFTIGTGVRWDEVEALRYANIDAFQTYFGYAQWQFKPIDKLEIISGVRADHHSQYGGRVTPKLSASYRLKNVTLKAAYGSGFKSPDFRQLYLDFNNEVVGYSVFGTEVLSERLSALEEQGVIDQVYIQPTDLGALQPETSQSFNGGLVIRSLNKQLVWEANVFHNSINQLIDVVAVAQKTNRQLVYSYQNQNQVITEGFDGSVKYAANEHWSFRGGIQYLRTRDVSVQRNVEQGKVFTKSEGELTSRRMGVEEYSGLFGRSPWTSNFKVAYKFSRANAQVYARWIWKSSYVAYDLNGNLIADIHDDKAPGFHTLNLTGSWDLGPFSYALTLKNLLNNQSVQYLPGNAGFQVFGTITYNIKQKQNESK